MSAGTETVSIFHKKEGISLKVYLRSYLSRNLGDDLFAAMLSSRYPDVSFVTYQGNSLSYQYPNIRVFNRPVDHLLDRALRPLGSSRADQILKSCDYRLLLGGSMFMEGRSALWRNFYAPDRTCVIGASFGPFRDPAYLDTFRCLFRRCLCVSLRDHYSYELFRDLGERIQVAPDIVCGLDVRRLREFWRVSDPASHTPAEQTSVSDNKDDAPVALFSVIDCNRKGLSNYTAVYEERMARLAEWFLLRGFQVLFMSFCRSEGDEDAIRRILSRLSRRNHSTKLSFRADSSAAVQVYRYRGNIEQALLQIDRCEIIVGTRFHANILGFVFGKAVLPVIYSRKTADALDDAGFRGRRILIRDIASFDPESLTQADLENRLDLATVSRLAAESERHFRVTDLLFHQKP